MAHDLIMAKTNSRAAASGRQAVVDIGSNSVRLVIYDGPRRAPVQICNEKALCGLGRDLRPDGKLDPAAVEYAIATLKRFRRLLEEHWNPPVWVIATSAVREAADGEAFVAAVKELGFDARVVGGSEEAQLAAMGVVSYEPGATGVVGDMGGGSLELVALDKGEVVESASLPIGPLRLMQQASGKVTDAARLVERALDGLDWLKPKRFKTIYSVGGAWRAIARLHMRLRSYPLSVLHHYELSRADAAAICDLIARQTPRSLQEMPGVPRRRLDTLPLAALVFRAVLDRTGVDRVMISAGGIREGVLYKDLSPEEKSEDPLLSGARFFAQRFSPEPAIGAVYEKLTAPLFADDSPAASRIRAAACILADIGAFFHPDLRAMQAFDTALRAPFYGVTHPERVAIALSLHARHAGRRPASADEHLLGLLTPEEQQRALRLGLALRFAGALAPKAPAAFAGCALRLDDRKVIFRAPKSRMSLMGELPRKRLESLASAFGAQAAEEYY
ncbi:MAG: Ppx/GppA family phosphatase [Alphaproteobacteria bacterium]|nr:Ppx/GppA family phosphatase [Alphaproteobacteria bacterium]